MSANPTIPPCDQSNSRKGETRQTLGNPASPEGVQPHEMFYRLDYHLRRQLDRFDLNECPGRIVRLILSKTLALGRWYVPFQKQDDIGALVKMSKGNVSPALDLLQRTSVVCVERRIFYRINPQVNDWRLPPFHRMTDDLVRLDRWTDAPPEQPELEFPRDPDLAEAMRGVILENFAGPSSSGLATAKAVLDTTLPGRGEVVGHGRHFSPGETEKQVPKSGTALQFRNPELIRAAFRNPEPRGGTTGGAVSIPVPVSKELAPCSLQGTGEQFRNYEQGLASRKTGWRNNPTPVETRLLEAIESAVGSADRTTWQVNWLNAWIRTYPHHVITWGVEETLLRVQQSRAGDFTFKTSPSAYLKGAITRGWRRAQSGGGKHKFGK
jgi:hypothetical protein